MSMKLNEQNQFEYAVIGGGCMGVSTALALQIEYPNAKIILFEGSETRRHRKMTAKRSVPPILTENMSL